MRQTHSEDFLCYRAWYITSRVYAKPPKAEYPDGVAGMPSKSAVSCQDDSVLMALTDAPRT